MYDHAQLRYDHHQRGFFETFDGANDAAKDGGRPDVTGPETATGTYKTKLSASGLVYKHYGREILWRLHAVLGTNPAALEWVYDKMYRDFMEAIDGNDNGIEVADLVQDVPVRAVFVSVSPFTGNANVGRSVPGCIEADCCNERFILQDFSSPARLARFCTAPSSKCAVFRIMISQNFDESLCC